MKTVEFIRSDGQELELFCDDDGNVDYRVKELETQTSYSLFVVVATDEFGERALFWSEDPENAFDAIAAYREGDPVGMICKDDNTLRFIEEFFDIEGAREVAPPDDDAE